ncbi:MAG: hypothetical protein R3E18_06160 [Sphingomonadaceae bacterium]|nr:hypothetical protein [Sphingomonadaceae bacterium]
MMAAIRPYARLAPVAALGLVTGCQCTPVQQEEASPPPGSTAEEFAAQINQPAKVAVNPANGLAPSVQPTGTSLPPEKLAPVSGRAPLLLGKVDGGCRFEQGGQTVFLAGAAASTDKAGRAVVMLDGVERVMPGTDLGGRQVVESGPTVTDGEYKVEVYRAAGMPEELQGERRWPAELVITSGAGQRRYPSGTWTCKS